jgi:hypothetical protein
MSTPSLVNGAGAVDEKCLRALLCVSGIQQGHRRNYSSKRKGVNVLTKADVQKKETGLRDVDLRRLDEHY